MVLQTRLLGESLAADVAGVRLIPGVNHHVTLQVGLAPEDLLALRAADVPLNGLLPGVDAQVSPQTAVASELGATMYAKQLSLDALVHQLEMLHQSLLPLKGLATALNIADERLLAGVAEHVAG